MVCTDNQIRRLFELMQTEKHLSKAAAKAGVDEKTARKYRDLGKLPSELKVERSWRTHEDAFEEIWDEVGGHLELNPGLEAKTLFEYLQRRYPGRFSDGQLRTFQRRVKVWWALEGPFKEVYFDQVHYPGELCQSDFTYMKDLEITVCGEQFDHMIYHFVLTYSNWESGTICFSESFESLSEGLQNALWELGGVPRSHQTDRLTAAVSSTLKREEFTARYSSLLSHYGLSGRKINTGRANENGDIEQRHHRFKRSLDQTLLLRGSRDFVSRQDYEAFLRQLFSQLNSGRETRFKEELKVLRRLPKRRLESYKRLRVKVNKGSLISVANKRGKHHVQYRHIIDWLTRKPGAFENYRYKADLFPTHRFRVAYDALKASCPGRANKEYLMILELAAKESEVLVDGALEQLIASGKQACFDVVNTLVSEGQALCPAKDVHIDMVDIGVYDSLLDHPATERAVF